MIERGTAWRTIVVVLFLAVSPLLFLIDVLISSFCPLKRCLDFTFSELGEVVVDTWYDWYELVRDMAKELWTKNK